MFIYLHGFSSSPHSTKAEYLRQQFLRQSQQIYIPDLNQGDFFHLSLSRQIQQVKALLSPEPDAEVGEAVTLIGSSFGGLTAAWLGEICPQVDRLVLLAPAFQFLDHWLPRLGTAQIQAWQTTGSMLTYHYSAKQSLPLGYQFVTDLAQYDENLLQRPLPTLILHGRQDDVIPIQASRDFATTRPWVKLIELDSDHALVDVQAEIWQMICAFCQINSG
ncbi:MAG: YqiA/YcfP family alpha/beta fold hydrolase [Elainella sp.]